MPGVFGRTSVKLAAVAALFVFGAAYFVLSMFGGQKEVVVARVMVKPGKAVAAADVKLQSLPKGSVPSGAMNNTTDIVGKSLKVVRYPGDTITSEMMTGKGSTDLTMKAGEYIMALDLTGGSIADMVTDGDTIAIMPLSISSAVTGAGTVDAPLISGVKVLRVDRKADAGSTSISGSSTVTATLYLVVDPAKAQKIGQAKAGKFDVVLEKKAG